MKVVSPTRIEVVRKQVVVSLADSIQKPGTHKFRRLPWIRIA